MKVEVLLTQMKPSTPPSPHFNILRSEVFAAMLRHEFLEKQNSRVDVKVARIFMLEL